jgi:hypothetical protein
MSQWNPNGNGYPPPQQGYPPNQYPPHQQYPGYPPQNYPQYHAAPPQQKSVASGVFWGLFLFFIVLPIGACGGCLACGALSGAGASKAGQHR